MSRRELERDGHAVLERWPRLEYLWRYCRHVDACFNDARITAVCSRCGGVLSVNDWCPLCHRFEESDDA